MHIKLQNVSLFSAPERQNLRQGNSNSVGTYGGLIAKKTKHSTNKHLNAIPSEFMV
jgi:hypothetical protein